ncbi:MAG: AMIN domain-containing protein [Albimonas sp.]|uniref:AMIN domain-containing protein n=1 Tax=Albimonas sp. TaxID=1872425 RepID=UPI004056C3EE
MCASAAALAAAFAFTPAPAPASEAPAAQAPRIIGLRHVEGRTRVALRLPRATGFEVFALADPPRLVVAFDAPAWEGAPPPPPPGGLVRAVRAGLAADGRARLVLELARPARLAEAVQFPDPTTPRVPRCCGWSSPTPRPTGSPPRPAGRRGGGRSPPRRRPPIRGRW